jgi:CPA1 family monovalent cation:H+ antiporter
VVSLTFLLNAALFILIGLQLPVIVDGLSGRAAGEVVGYAALVCAAVIAVRFLWNFTVTFLIRAVDRRASQRARRGDWRSRVVGSWTGMRAPCRWRRRWRSRSRPPPARPCPAAS